MEIYCPKCNWEPHKQDRWGCSCGHSWNTFDTFGQCPACGKVWKDTQCLSFACLQWSKHHDWYHDDARVELEEIIREVKKIEIPIL